MQPIERVVLVHRLREVVAQVGFTRFEALAPDIEGELEMGVRRAALAREITWLPAVENRGEGIFLQFSHEAVEAWTCREDVQDAGPPARSAVSTAGSRNTKEARRVFPGLAVHHACTRSRIC